MGYQRTCCIITYSYFFSVKVHFCHTDTGIGCYGRRLDNNSHICALAIIEGCRNGMCYRLTSIEGKYHIFAINPEAKAIFNTRDKSGIVIGYILLHHSELNSHTVLPHSCIIERTIM